MNKIKYYDSTNHIDNLIDSPYYKVLVELRNSIAIACDKYFQELNAPRVDLFLISQGVSSPMGKGSDSLPIEIEFDTQHAYLADSSQFGMEPLVQKNFEMVYCYLPSFRGEDPDNRHLNQFYHCEAELQGGYEKAMDIAERLVKEIINKVLNDYSDLEIGNYNQNIEALKKLLLTEFPRITMDEAEELLKQHGCSEYVEKKTFGRVLSNKAELKIAEIVGNNNTPVWVTKYDRDTVPFYQKPDPENPELALNADLIFPPLNGGFGGEILGLGERQNKADEILNSINRQNVKGAKNYDWYINLRNRADYVTTSGFGLGIERLIAWLCGIESIIDTSIYPVIKNGKTI